MMKIKKNDFVFLSKEAIERFYGRVERIEDYAVGGNLDNLTTEQVLEFMDTYLGFENGTSYGLVTDIVNDTARVIFQNHIRYGIDYSFYNLKDLKKVELKIK